LASVVRSIAHDERSMVGGLLRHLAAGIFLLWDRNFFSYPLWLEVTARGAAILARAKSNLILKPIRELTDGSYLAKARGIESPEVLEVVPVELFEKLAGTPIARPKTFEQLAANFLCYDESFEVPGWLAYAEAHLSGHGGAWTAEKLEAWFEQHDVEYRPAIEAGSRLKYVLDSCPFNEAHMGRNAAVFLTIDGAEAGTFGFHCFHDGCADKNWKDLREHIEGPTTTTSSYSGEDAGRFDERLVGGVNAKRGDGASAFGMPPPEPAATGQPVRRRRGYKPSQIRLLPLIEWQVQDHFPTHCLVMIFGASGVGKSFVGLDIALSVAGGSPYQGKHEVKQGGVIYIASEGFGGPKKPLAAWQVHHGLDDLPDDICFVPDAFDLTTADEKELRDLLLIAVADLGQVPGLVVIDTVNSNFGSADENSTKDMSSFVRDLDWIRTKLRSTVLVVHHTRKDEPKGERGNVSLRGACDSIIRLEETDGGKAVSVHNSKQ
jgi:hypothetical protein